MVNWQILSIVFKLLTPQIKPQIPSYPIFVRIVSLFQGYKCPNPLSWILPPIPEISPRVGQTWIYRLSVRFAKHLSKMQKSRSSALSVLMCSGKMGKLHRTLGRMPGIQCHFLCDKPVAKHVLSWHNDAIITCGTGSQLLQHLFSNSQFFCCFSATNMQCSQKFGEKRGEEGPSNPGALTRLFMTWISATSLTVFCGFVRVPNENS